MNINHKDSENTLMSSVILSSKFRQLSIPRIASYLCQSIIIMIDCAIAVKVVGTGALAAIALCVPFFTIDEMLHNLLGYGTSTLMIRERGRNNLQKANRILTSLLISVFALYIVVLIPFIIFRTEFFMFFTKDTALVEQAIRYFLPMVCAMPLFEVLRCIENACQIDGRAVFFSSRAIMTCILNILLDFLFVLYFDMGIAGLAWANIVATFFGYCVTLTHLFSKRCSIKLDFSVFRSWKESVGYIKESAMLGAPLSANEFLGYVIAIVTNKVILLTGGVATLAVWAVFTSLLDIVVTIETGVSKSTELFVSMLHGAKNYNGVRMIIKSALRFALLSGAALMVFVLIFSEQLAVLFQLDIGTGGFSKIYLQLGVLSFPAASFILVVSTIFLCCKREKESWKVILSNNILFLLILILSPLTGAWVIFSGYTIVNYLVLLFMAVQYKNGVYRLPEETENLRMEVSSMVLSALEITEVSSNVQEKMIAGGYDEHMSMRVGLLVEEIGMNIIRFNQDSLKTLLADMQICVWKDAVHMSIYDNGMIYNPMTDIENAVAIDEEKLSSYLIRKASSKVQFDRVLEINILTVDIDLE